VLPKMRQKPILDGTYRFRPNPTMLPRGTIVMETIQQDSSFVDLI